VDGSVGAVGAPPLRASAQRGRVRAHAAEPLGGAQEPEVGGRKRVGVAEGAERDVRCGPLPDPRERDEPRRGRPGRLGGAQDLGLPEHLLRERDEGVRPRPREPDALQRRPGEARRPGERDPEPVRRDRLAVRRCDSSRDRPRRRHADLLPQDRAHRDLEWIPGAGDPQARAGSDERPEHRIALEARVDRDRVRVQVEEVPEPGHHARHRRAPAGAHRRDEAAGLHRRAHRDRPRQAFDHERAAVLAARDLLDPGHRPRAEEREHRVPRVGQPVLERDRRRSGIHAGRSCSPGRPAARLPLRPARARAMPGA
jgi:hypothetical protein